jgi:hypothetical protein
MAPLRCDRQLAARLGVVAQALADSDSPASKGRLAGADPSSMFDFEPITGMRACGEKEVARDVGLRPRFGVPRGADPVCRSGAGSGSQGESAAWATTRQSVSAEQVVPTHG